MNNFARTRSAILFLALLPTFALAQPDANNAPKAQNPPNQNPGGNRRLGGFGGPGGFFGRRLSDEQRQQLEVQNQRMRDIQQRQTLILSGVTDPKAQDAILLFTQEQEAARGSLRSKWNALQQALNNDTPDTQIATLLNDFRSAVDDERARRDKARSALDVQIGLSKNPRLEAQLMTSGILGDEASLVNGNDRNVGFMNGFNNAGTARTFMGGPNFGLPNG